jgi:GTP-binding protein Era
MDFTSDLLMNSNSNLKSGFVTMVGRPNVGKSTLLNYIMGQKLAITSNKPQTTRKKIRAVLTEEDKGQIVFLDTPGIHKSKSKLGNYMSQVVKGAVSDVDVVIWLVEPKLPIHKEDKEIVKALENIDKPVILGVNKIDMVKKDVLKDVLDAYQNLAPFADVYPFSARSGKGIQQLMDAIYDRLPYGPFYYDPEEYTDQTERQLVCETIREKSLHALRDEIPHGIAVTVESMKERKNKPIVDIEATIICEKDSHKGIIIGKGGAMLKKIGSNARFEIERMLDMKANLQIHVKVKKDWRDNIGVLKSLGYTEDEE